MSKQEECLDFVAELYRDFPLQYTVIDPEFKERVLMLPEISAEEIDETLQLVAQLNRTDAERLLSALEQQ